MTGINPAELLVRFRPLQKPTTYGVSKRAGPVKKKNPDTSLVIASQSPSLWKRPSAKHANLRPRHCKLSARKSSLGPKRDGPRCFWYELAHLGRPNTVQDEELVVVESQDEDDEPEPLNNANDLGRGIIKTKENKMKVYTILLVGETGTGKTSFLSLLGNILIGNNPKQYVFFHDEGNEAGGAKTQSQTNSAMLYEFVSNNGITVRILDTPGLVDTRGLAQDEIHKAGIASAIEESIPFVNAVIILANGTVERLGAATDYALTTLSSIFPRTLADNIGIVFTNVASPLSWNFDQGSLPDALRGIENNQFLLDNPLALWKKLNEFCRQRKASKRAVAELESAVDEGHAKALRALSILFDWLDTLVPQPTKEIINLHKKSEEIERNIANALSRASHLRDKKDELEKIKASMDGNAITMQLYENLKRAATRPVWEQVNADTLNMICLHPRCHSNCRVIGRIEQNSSQNFTIYSLLTIPLSWLNIMIVEPISRVFRRSGDATPAPCQACHHPAENHSSCPSLWKRLDDANWVMDEDAEMKYNEAKQKNEENREIMVDLDRTIASLNEEMKQALALVGRLVESYASLSLMGSFAGQVKKAVRLMEMNLEATRNKNSDPSSITMLEKSVEILRKKLKVVEEASQRSEMIVIRRGR